MNPIFVFAEHGMWDEVFEELCEMSVHDDQIVHQPNPQNGMSLLHYAVLKNEVEAVEDLLAIWRARVNVHDYKGRSPIALARELNFVEVMDLLHEANTNELLRG